MIKGVHATFVSPAAQELRAFIRDKLKLPYSDPGGGWLVFELSEAELGCHSVDSDDKDSGTLQISFYCDDIESTMAQLEARGVEFSGGVSELSWGLTTSFQMPGGFEVVLYQPRYSK